jgi:hypothetical protein
LQWLLCQKQSGLKSRLLWLGVGTLVLLSVFVNVLGIAVDFNQHFSRLDSNENFVFNWAAFPPLAHWRILREGLVDVIWLRPITNDLKIEWPVLLPALLLLVLASVNLVITFHSRSASPPRDGEGATPGLQVFRLAPYLFLSVVVISLTFLVMRGTAHIQLADQQAKADLPMMDALADSAQPGDVLLVPMPAFGDVQEISTRLMAYLEPALPTYAWIESGPRAIQPDERERIQQSMQDDARRAWLFERWLTPGDLTTTANSLDQGAFPIYERWFTDSGRLTLYALDNSSQPLPPAKPLNVPFQGGLTLVSFALRNEGLVVQPGDVVRLRLAWQAPAVSGLAPQDIPTGGIVVTTQVLDRASPARNIAQNDRLLLDMQNLAQSPLNPGQTIQQGFGLQLPNDVAPGSYPLIVGLYHTESGQRLMRADASPDDFVYLTDIMVEEACCE